MHPDNGPGRIAFDSIICVDPALLLRTVEVYETDRIDFAEAYLVACAESTGVGNIASFERSIDRVNTVERIEPGRSHKEAPTNRADGVPPDDTPPANGQNFVRAQRRYSTSSSYKAGGGRRR